MIPSILTQQIHQGVKDFLSTTFHSTNPFFHGMLERFLDTDGNLSKGPYISLQLPFQKGGNKEYFPHIPLSFTPFLHQEKAFERLSGPNPQPTLVATGTGSGKTECFLLPILEHCRQNFDQPGIKAILIYPMNALAFDQATRLARTIHDSPELHGKITAGLFVGQGKADSCPDMTRDSIITDKEIIRDNPPDILLTNYKMLDYLLTRARDARLWAKNEPRTLRFVVVDELHTFDGAQGTDLACLLRRLKAKLGAPKHHICPIGTSATLGGDQSWDLLLEYAQQVFGEPMDQDGVIAEHRQSADEFLRDHLISHLDIPGPEKKQELSPGNYATSPEFIQAQAGLWTGLDQPGDLGEEIWEVKLGKALKEHVFVHNLLRVINNQVRSYQDIISELAGKASPQLRQGDWEYAYLLLNSILACISAARIRDESGLQPFIQVRVQHWYRELRRMVCRVDRVPEISFSDDLTQEQQGQFLPLLHCRECGQTGWVGRMPMHGSSLQTDLKSIYVDFFSKKPTQRLTFLFPEEGEGDSESFPGYRLRVCPVCLRLGPRTSGKCEDCDSTDSISVLSPESASPHCPSCGAHNSLTLLGSRSASLTSVMIGQLMASTYNSDPKCIAFSDNVQDAAHRAGFFGARTFRFTFRSALQQYVQNEGDGRSLDQVAQEMPRYWQERMNPETFAATFLPANLTWLQDAEHLERHDHLPRDSNLCDLIYKRLRFETVSEYGFSSRIGRTLEKSGASVLRPDPERLEQSVDLLKDMLPSELEEMRGQPLEHLPAFLLGLMTRIRHMGGIFDPDLEGYLQGWGREYYISQGWKLWMPSFGPRTRTPGFVTTRPGIQRFAQLTRSGSRNSWFEWWAYQHFPNLALRQPTLAQRFYYLIFKCLADKGLTEDRFQNNHHVYGLAPESLLITCKTAQFQCGVCWHSISGADAEAPIWESTACLRRGCSGRYQHTGSGQDYYGSLYSQGRIKRLVAREHTGLLDRESREELERRFKAEGDEHKPWYPNLLSSTPTLEMGIDIGDLSTTLQCSVPPGQANYIQRIGRSGRKEGNALNLTVAAGKAHDLYFFAQPQEMLQGYVHPPGVFLDASAVLERQLTAFCLDCWIGEDHESDPVPGRLGTVLDTFRRDDATLFPHNLIHFIQDNQTKLLNGFLALFAGELSPDSRDHLHRFVFGDTQETPGLGHRILGRLFDLYKERKSLKTQVDRLYREIKRRENSPARDQNYEREMDELRRERSGLMALIRSINARDTYNFFTDEGLLPNYAFPEQGILLKSIIYRRRRIQQQGQGKYESLDFEYERPASAGLRELAPGNRFYAEGRRVEVDRIDMKQAEVEAWRLCANCPHCEPEATARQYAVCPRCGSVLWNDQGRRQDLVRLRQVMATAPDWMTRISDDSDDRDPMFYTTQLLVDVDPLNIRDAYHFDSQYCPFGFEFISKAVFRDINFGPAGENAQPLLVAGEEVERPGFLICRHCGKVQKAGGDKGHAYGCPAREKDDDSNFIKSVFLYREFTSEAIRILVPVTGFEPSRKRLDSFVAALQLGLRHHFGGSAYAIEHLQSTVIQEPVPESGLRKQYLVIFDTVPGGTGFLKQLMRSETMLTVLEKAWQAMRDCACGQSSDRDGCYSCLLAFRNSYSMPTTSRQTAMEILSTILNHRGTLRQAPDLNNIRVEGLSESQLESLFLEGLKLVDRQETDLSLRQEVVRGKPGNFLRLGGHAYEIEPQVDLGQSHGVAIPSRADFVIWPSRARDAGRPIAVFTDGLAFHRNRMGQDAAQRMALVQSGNFFVWSLAWKDVHSQVQNRREKIADLLRPGDSRLGREQFSRLLDRMDLQNCRNLHTRDNFSLLAEFLANPHEKQMQNYALAQAISLLDMPGSKDPESKEAWLQAMSGITPDLLVREMKAEEDRAVWGGLESGPISLFVFAPYRVLQQADPAGVLLVCCLDDGEQAQEEAEFERSWINYLRLFNIFQFLPRALFVTTQGLEQDMYAQLVDSLSQESQMPDTEDYSGQDQAWKEVLELVDPRLHGWVRELRKKNQSIPEVGFELVLNGRVAAVAELAWPGERMAYLTREQAEGAEIFRSQGWEVTIAEDGD